MTFQDIVNQLNSAIAEHPELTVEQALEGKLAEMGLDEDARSRVMEACGIIDSYQKEYDNLLLAKAHGKSRRAWIENKVEKATEQFPEEERNVILAAIAKQLQKVKSWITKS